MPQLLGLDARVWILLLLPVAAPVWKLEVLVACGAAGGFLAAARAWRGLTPETALRRVRAALAGRRRAAMPEHRPVKTAWRGE